MVQIYNVSRISEVPNNIKKVLSAYNIKSMGDSEEPQHPVFSSYTSPVGVYIGNLPNNCSGDFKASGLRERSLIALSW